MRNPKFLGVYSQKKQTGRSPLRYFVWRLPDGSYAVQELDSSLSARGPARAVPAHNFDQLFYAEPSILAAPVTTPDFRHLQAPAPKPTSAPIDDSSFKQLEKARQARQVENDLRDSFARALRALGRPKDKKGALIALERLAATTKGIAPEHKHMFRDFGVAMRKKSLPELSLAFAARAVELAPNDDHARFNLARILGLLGRYDEAAKELGAALKLDPEEKIYMRLGRHLAREKALKQEFLHRPDEDDSGANQI